MALFCCHTLPAGRARVRPFRCGAHVGISWTRPRPSLPVRWYMSGSADAPASVPSRCGGTCRDQLDASRVCPFWCGARPGRPLPPRRRAWGCGDRCASSAGGPSGAGAAPKASRRQGTTGPGDALMVGIPAARLYF